MQHFFCVITLNFLKDLCIFRGGGREGERDRNINVWFSLTRPLLGTWWATMACALAGTRTCDPLVCSQHSFRRTTPARTHFTKFLNKHHKVYHHPLLLIFWSNTPLVDVSLEFLEYSYFGSWLSAVLHVRPIEFHTGSGFQIAYSLFPGAGGGRGHRMHCLCLWDSLS